ncbi:aspartate kinase [Romboutsia lituseburensis]|uniref:Aspartokinase n=1 Tax=Romboutsia lituseburensis DSM 797 TaxID=1121325 RepID=A0A1G9LCE4_9FIRM|nr:aspartate kinase [Romboutsia lituseburensis]SDL59433.1 aspartate kinase [Romboutsia lituseburensis DSM 797]
MEILVQKFGGTSVESYEKMNEVCKIIKSYKESKESLGLVVVVSAMGRQGAPYATDTLISLCDKINNEPSKRELDIIMSCGEMISGTILVNMLKSRKIDSVFLTGNQAGITTTDNFSNAKITDINPQRIFKELETGKVVVIAGFQGATESGEITTLGRGGSDTSAVAIGKALGCDVVEIYTDVDGIMTADPRVEPEAKVLKCIDYEEVFQMADKGAKVIHPRAVQLAKSANITLCIKNTLNPSCEGTKICLDCISEIVEYEKENSLMTAVAHKDKVAQIKVKSDEETFSKILNQIENKNISIDMINFFIEEKSFVVEEDSIEDLEEILKKYSIEYKINKDCAKVTLIGAKISGTPGVMAKVVRALSKSKIQLLQTSDSSMTISCLVKKEDMSNTVHAIHNEFYLK